MPPNPSYDRKLNAVVLDLATHPVDAFAVVYHGKLLPIRFSTDDQAFLHLRQMLAGPAEEVEAA